MPTINSPVELEAFRKEIVSKRDPNKPCITLCSGTACHATGSKEVASAIQQELEHQGLTKKVDFRRTGCHGFCEKGPIVVIDPEKICYLQVTPEDVPEMIASTIKEKKILDRLVYTDPTTGEKTNLESEIPFYKHQQRLVFGANRRIAPQSLEDYLADDGGKALVKAL
ncbi:MAG: NAD(P)H-dependent oxidoreductase subunit E, partial [Planctomycetota bacterium]